MANILVVEDERLIARLLKETLQVEGYQVVTVLHGEDAVQFTLRETPHLVLLDMKLPDIDGHEVVRRLRSHPKSMHIPIIVLSALDDSSSKVQAFELGVDDYITKPFDTGELLARVRTQLRRVQQNFLSPLIGLPGGYQVELAIKQKLTSANPWSILYLDLDNFKAFNDVYGFLTGNDLIRLVGRICQHVVRDYGNPDDFVGHIGGDDYVIITAPDRAQHMCGLISSIYKKESQTFYHPEDLRRGSISGVDRKGRPYQFPLVSLSIGVVNNHARRSHTLQEVSYLAAEAKCQAKQSTSNVYHISPRRECEALNQELLASRSPTALTSRYTFAQPLPPALAQFALGHVHREPDLVRLKDKPALVDLEQKVYQAVPGKYER
ncbi:MAG TPA: response regulator [Ktedonobacteraceae bacterium]|jgi:diguanylate cyclase (GGDEF)-like protein